MTDTKTINALARERDSKLYADLEAKEARVKELESQIEAIRTREEEATRSISARLEAANKEAQALTSALWTMQRPYDNEKRPLNDERYVLAKEAQLLQTQVYNLEKQISGELAAQNTEHLPLTDIKALSAFLKSIGASTENLEQVQKPLPNGVVLFRTKRHEGRYSGGDDLLAYYAVIDRKLVGLQHTRRGTEAFSYSYSHAWINQTVFSNETEAKIRGSSMTGVMFTDWKEQVKKLDVFIGADLDSPVNRSVISNW
jgi:hypothetical protein